jgi:hypothetical protein
MFLTDENMRRMYGVFDRKNWTKFSYVIIEKLEELCMA